MSEFVLGPDVDLDTEVVLDARGKRVTEREASAVALGRPSLGRGRGRSRQISVRVPKDIEAELDRECKRTGKSTSDIARQALLEHFSTGRDRKKVS